MRNRTVAQHTSSQSPGAGAGKAANRSWRGRDYLGPREGAGQRVLPTEPDWPGRAEGWGPGLIPLGASHVGCRAVPRKGHALIPQCTAGRVTRSGRSRLDRYGLAPPSLRVFPLGVAQPPGRPLPSVSPPPAGAGTKPVPWGREPGVVGTTGLGEGGMAGISSPFVPFDLRALRGRAGGGGPSADLPRTRGSRGRGADGWGPSRRAVSGGGGPRAQVCRKHRDPPWLLRCPRGLTWHCLLPGRAGFEPAANSAFCGD